MEPISVLVSDEIAEDLLPEIESVDSRINATHVGRLLSAEQEGDHDAAATLDALLSAADVYAGIRIPPRLIQRAPHLKWVQVTRAGVDRLLLDEGFRRSPVILTNVGGVHSYGPAELAIQSCLVHVKGTIECDRQKREKKWEPFQTGVLKNRTMGIVGYGNIGRRVARVAKAFEMWVIAARRSVGQSRTARLADVLLPMTELDHLLSESDFVILATPLTPDTYHMIGSRQLSLMKRDALLVNVSRGPVVDEAALIWALETHQIGAAALDVFEQEPLPNDSPLWTLPNVIFSPHLAGNVPAYPRLVQELFLENLKRYVRGETLKNVVNKRRGY